jgi:hypothetical protein
MTASDKDIEIVVRRVTEALSEQITNSHMATAKVSSNLLGDMKTKLEQHIIQHETDTKEINRKLDALDDVLPIIEAYRGGKIFGNALKWLAGIGTAYLLMRGILSGKL